MSVLMHLRRLLTARKVWRVFTTKLQNKLHKLNRSKAGIKKHKKKKNHELMITTTATSSNKAATLNMWPFQSRFQKRKRPTRSCSSSSSNHPVPVKYKPRHRYQKKSSCSAPPAVYVDELFIEPPPVLARRDLQPAIKKGKVEVNDDDHQAAVAAGTSWSRSKGSSGGDNYKSHSSTSMTAAADDMWESLVLASPQMHGINERAEEFISRFRAEMQVQEMSIDHNTNL